MKKRLLRLSKRILILTLCTTLLSGSVFSKYKITANAAAMTATLGSYAAYEICLYIGGALIATCGLGAAIENRDQIAEAGKNFIDSLNLDDVSGWLLSKVTTTGQSYVYGTEALQEVQDMSFTVIQGGGNKPENDDDNDDDGDIDADDRTKELEQMGMWATTYFVDIIEEGVKPLIEGLRNGEDTIISEIFPVHEPFFDENVSAIGPDGKYHYSGYVTYSFLSNNQPVNFRYEISDVFISDSPVVAYYKEFNNLYFGTYTSNFSLKYVSVTYTRSDANNIYNDSVVKIAPPGSYPLSTIALTMPVFSDEASAINYLQNGVLENCLNNKPKVYQIADWLQEHWTSALEQLNTGIRSLNDNMLIVGEAANQALINQLNGLGYIESLAALIAAANPLPLPGTVADPIYYPIDSPVPPLDPGDYPWVDPVPVPDPDPVDPPGGDDGSITDDDIRGTDSFGISTLFGILILLIMILLMLLMIFLSCLAFVIMIFRIPATTGFLPEEMIAGLDYLKTLEIPGFGMSVYAFFMALIYIILIFTVIGMLRKNIDKIKFPRKGKW